jgi:hypothetical protein
MKDSKYISEQPHEIKYVVNSFLSKSGQTPPAPLIYFLHNEMKVNKKKVLRSELYQILELAGYYKK